MLALSSRQSTPFYFLRNDIQNLLRDRNGYLFPTWLPNLPTFSAQGQSMKPAAVVVAAALLVALTACSPTTRRSAPATFANPVIDSDFPDPAILQAKDGFYYVYATQTERDGRWINLQVA